MKNSDELLDLVTMVENYISLPADRQDVILMEHNIVRPNIIDFANIVCRVHKSEILKGSGYTLADIGQMFGYSKAQTYQLAKVADRFTDEEMQLYGPSILQQTNILPERVAKSLVGTVIEPGMKARHVAKIVQEEKLKLNRSSNI